MIFNMAQDYGKLTILQILPELKGGGVERGTLELGRYLTEHGHRSLVISQGGGMVNQLVSEGSEHIKWDYVGEKSPRALKHILPLRRLLVEEKVDILHLRSRLPAWIGYLAWKSLPEKARPGLVTTFHGFYSINPYSAVMTKGEKVIAVSNTIAEHIHKEYGIPENRIKVIYRGVDRKVFSREAVTPGRVQGIKDQWKLSENHDPIIMLPGRFTRLKGHDVFLEALDRIKQFKWKAVCVGQIDHGSEYINDLKKQVSELGLRQRVLLADQVDDMPAAMMLADIVVSSSTKPESFGRILIEALSMGRAVIATAHGGSLELVSQGRTGWLVKPGSADSLALALKEAISREELRDEFGSQGISDVQNNFTLDKMCLDSMKVYKNLLSEKK